VPQRALQQVVVARLPTHTQGFMLASREALSRSTLEKHSREARSPFS
jgi:hypothetical protein